MTRMTISPSIHFDAASEDASCGAELAQEVWFFTGEGRTQEDAARQFAEAMMEAVITEPVESVAAMLYGAASFFMDIAGKPVITQKEQEQ